MKTVKINPKQEKIKQEKKTKEVKPKKPKKGKSMYANGLYSTEGVNIAVAPADLLPPEEAVNISLSTSQKNRGYIFVDHKNIQEIYEKSGPLAKENEFQVHYWFLNFRYTAEDGSHIDVAVPTCYFNYNQFVTSGHIDFELTDVIPVSEALLPVHNMKVNQLMKTDLHSKINEIFGVTFEPMSVNFGTLHRHPGQSTHQSFSSTDLNVNVKTKRDSLGVVFPLATAEDDKPSFSMIIAVDGQTNHYYNPSAGIANLAHSEYRIANGDIKTGLHYEKNRCIAFSIKKRTKPSLVEKMFGAKEVSNTVVRFNNTESALVEQEQTLASLFEGLYDGVYTASTDIVLPTNVKQKVSAPAAKTVYKAPANAKHHPQYYYNEDDIEEMYKSFEEEQEIAKKADNAAENPYTKNMKVSIKDYNNAVAKLHAYEKNEKLQVLLDAFQKKDLTYGTNLHAIKKCVDDYNLVSIAYYGTPENQLELIETYVTEVEGNFTFDLRDIADFSAEITLTIENILTEKADFRKTISMFKMLNIQNTTDVEETTEVNEQKIEQIEESKVLEPDGNNATEDKHVNSIKTFAQDSGEVFQENKSIFKKATEAVGTLFHKEQDQK